MDCTCGHDREAHTFGNSGNLSYPAVREFLDHCKACNCDDWDERRDLRAAELADELDEMAQTFAGRDVLINDHGLKILRAAATALRSEKEAAA
jgi:hypothetical protein